jgi:tRNA modification GTPase
VEELGIARTRERLGQADLVLYLMDGSQPLTAADREGLAQLTAPRGLAVINKIDLPQELDEEELPAASPFAVARISALTGQGVPALKDRIVELVLGGGLPAQGEIITQARHYQQLQDCLACLTRAEDLLAAEPPWELVALELKEALRALDEITGREVGDDVLDRIFSQFCLGK